MQSNCQHVYEEVHYPQIARCIYCNEPKEVTISKVTAWEHNFATGEWTQWVEFEEDKSDGCC